MEAVRRASQYHVFLRAVDSELHGAGIAKKLEKSQSTVSDAMDSLKQVGLVSVRLEGRKNIYSLTSTGSRVLAFLDGFSAEMNPKKLKSISEKIVGLYLKAFVSEDGRGADSTGSPRYTEGVITRLASGFSSLCREGYAVWEHEKVRVLFHDVIQEPERFPDNAGPTLPSCLLQSLDGLCGDPTSYQFLSFDRNPKLESVTPGVWVRKRIYPVAERNAKSPDCATKCRLFYLDVLGSIFKNLPDLRQKILSACWEILFQKETKKDTSLYFRARDLLCRRAEDGEVTAAQEDFAESCLEETGKGDVETVEKAEDVLDALLKGLRFAGQRPSGRAMSIQT